MRMLNTSKLLALFDPLPFLLLQGLHNQCIQAYTVRTVACNQRLLLPPLFLFLRLFLGGAIKQTRDTSL